MGGVATADFHVWTGVLAVVTIYSYEMDILVSIRQSLYKWIEVHAYTYTFYFEANPYTPTLFF